MSSTPHESRVAAFISRSAPEVFHSVQHRHEIWRADPFDVESLHLDAREAFGRLIARATTPPGLPSGRILLVLGEAGSGKTHLMRAFRNEVHGSGDGYVAYLQMTTSTTNYGRYLLSNLIDSLDQPYNEEVSTTLSGLMRLSRGVAARCQGALLPLHAELAPEQWELDTTIHDAANAVLREPDLADLDLGLVRALLYLQADDPRIKARVLRYLRCEDLAAQDRAMLGDLVPRIHDDDPERLVEAIGMLIWKLSGRSLVMCLDQLEDVWNMDDAKKRFRLAMGAVCSLADRVPSSIFVISCLEDFYKDLAPALAGSVHDRIETDPEPIRLKGERTLEEVRAMIGKRLTHLYGHTNAPFDPSQEVDPIPDKTVATWANLRTRDVLEHCRRYRDASIASGRVPPDGLPNPTTIPPPPPPPHTLQQEWNDFRAVYDKPRPDGDDELAALLAWAIGACGDELESSYRFTAKLEPKGAVRVDMLRDREVTGRRFVAVCNRNAKGGGLALQLAGARAAAGADRLVLVRSSEFPSARGTQIAKALGDVITSGGRRAVLSDSECLTMLAIRDFRATREKRPGFADFLAYENPLSQLPSIRTILDLDDIEPPGSTPATAPRRPAAESTAGAPAAPDPSPPPVAPPQPAVDAPAALHLGMTDGISPRELSLPIGDLRTHAAFLGGTGSGKTTLALGIVEQLLVAGVPVILVDRKGDLCGYADESAWGRPLGDPAREARRRTLRDHVATAIYTPGVRAGAGRPLGITLLPRGIESLPPDEQESEATYAAHGLSDMLGYKSTGRDQSCRAVLGRALKLLAGCGQASLGGLIEIIGDEDPALMAEIGRLDPKLFKKIVNDLETFRMTNAALVSGAGEQLDVAALFGRDGSVPPGKTRLSVVSTKFFGDTGMALFWVSQLLVQLGRWASHSPSPTLQAVVMFDEADLYLPATKQPATKAPMENLLKRARSGGLGVLLATQSPGDLDYKCRDNVGTWMLGKITQPVALQKMRPLLSDMRGNIDGKLATRQVGQFFLAHNGEATSFAAQRSAIDPTQIPEADILALASAGLRAASAARG